ncbi:sensor histidine kinase [Desulfomonile tiedjei]|uniref:histidine kinase n=1 Tax=Desulfomonile tiedjei (strain ATCC 49306 / DSM 6799 / DCB-1) TaxID=706587 RepID=I4C746_DESTA|nr:PAS domain-containing sensor histidine kinase [Desulfomonile tiedjei]AFM25387.1 histidine kinase [Desulfomonile tiedjei DSM 6799]
MASKHYKTLRLKIIVMTLFFSFIPLLALGLTIFYLFDSGYNNKNKEALRILSQSRRSAIELFFDERIAQLITIAHTHSLDQVKDEKYLKQVFDTIQSRSKSFIDVSVIDELGAHLAYVGPYYDKLKAVNYAHEEWFQAVMSSRVYVSDIFMGFRRIPHFIIAVTRYEDNRTWILRATINSEIIENIVREGMVGKKGDAFIVNRQNILQTSPRFSGKILSHPNTPDFSSVMGMQLEEHNSNGDKDLFAASSIPNPRWVLVLREDLREQMGPLLQAQYAGGLVLMAGLLIILTGTILTSRSMTNELIRVELEKAKSDDLVVQSSKMAALGKMAAGIAHEINNPLAIIGEKAGWMKDLLDKEEIQKSENWEEFEDCIRKIERQVERTRTITHRLLRFGRRMEPTQEMVDVNNILSETLTFLEAEALNRDIKIVSELGSQLPRITTDSAQLQQVFLNIVDNAIDAVGKGGLINIKTGYDQSKNGDIFVEIQDNGPGIPKEALSKIFDPFFTTKAPAEGTGLGLSISYSIVEKLGGKITVQSEEGKGTTFVIYVPVR